MLQNLLSVLLLVPLLLGRTADAAEIYGAGYVCDEVDGVFRLAYSQKIGIKDFEQDYSGKLTTFFGAGLGEVTCTLNGAAIKATVLVTSPSDRKVCGGAPALTVQEVIVNGRSVLTQAVTDSHCRAGYALLGVGVDAQNSGAKQGGPRTTIETVWGRNSPAPQILREFKPFSAVGNLSRRDLAPWDPEFGQPDPGISGEQIAKLAGSLSGACSAVFSLYDANDSATLAPAKLVDDELQKMGLHVDRVTASVEVKPKHPLMFQSAHDSTISWHSDLLPQPMVSAANNTWSYVPARNYVGWDSVLFQIFFNEHPAFAMNYWVYVVDRNSSRDRAACPHAHP